MPRLQPKRFLFIKRGDDFIASVGTDQNQNTAAQADIAAFSPAMPTSLKLKIMIFK